MKKDKETMNALARHKGEPLPYPEIEEQQEISQEEIKRRMKINRLALKSGNSEPYPEATTKRVIEYEKDNKTTYAAECLPGKRELEYVYIEWSHLYSNYIPFEIVEKCERESYEQAKSTFNHEGEETFKICYSNILRRKLEYAKSQAYMPRRINDESEVEKVKKGIEFYKNDYIKNPEKWDDEEPGDQKPTSHILELPRELEEELSSLKKKEKQYIALLCSLQGIPLDKIAAQELGVSREAICRKGGIKDRIRQKLGEGWEKEILPNRYEYL